ncbi:MAG: hypothetical protein CSA42_07490 [Gammaproteobacteria bacterium]|nr:MAG: hypothetical protein CSA42_07490 [Gammaproteobacteria bacterium]
MKRTVIILLCILVPFLGTTVFAQTIVIDHTCAQLEPMPASAILQAKQMLHIAYAHTSHGSQIITGMTALIGQTNLKGYKGDIYRWNEGGGGGALDIDDYFIDGDLGHNGDVSWANPTRTYLDSHPDVNVVMYSWCGGCSDNTPQGIQTYLNQMNELEQEYPNVTFVYMTGHRDIWSDATLKANNQQIRDYCVANGKVLYDFADIESYNPDGMYYEFANDNCDYYSGPGTGYLGNWAEEWQNTHTEGVDWYDCSPAHTKALNGNLKAYAAWWLWCRLAGWEGHTGIDTYSQNSIKLYPNPATDKLSLEMPITLLNSYVYIYNQPGQIVWQQQITSEISVIDVKRLKSGVYLLKTDVGVQKLIIR